MAYCIIFMLRSASHIIMNWKDGLFQVLLIALLLHPVVEANDGFTCPTNCLCISGNVGKNRVANIIEEQHVADAWNRFQTTDKAKSTDVYLCKNSNFIQIHHAMISTADALFMDGNRIETLDVVEPSHKNLTLDYRPFPTLVLSLSNNRIKNISASFMQSVPHLRLLILRNNFLDNLLWTKGQKSQFPEMVELDMSENTLRSLTPEDIGEFPLLTRLDLSGNSITYVDEGALLIFPKLEYLDLSSNRIKELGINTDRTEFPSISFLSLANNSIVDIEDGGLLNFFPTVPSLTSLDLSNNKITSRTIPYEAFSGFYNLRILNLSSCNIEYFDEGWLNDGPETTLNILDISRNLIKSVSANYLSVLVEDDVSRDTTSTLRETEIQVGREQTFRSLTNLEVLYMNDNYMLSVIEDDAFEYIPKVRLLFLQNCNIHQFKIATMVNRLSPQPISSTLPALTSIWIFDNPIICDCNLRYLMLWSNPNAETGANITRDSRRIDSPVYIVESKEIRIEVGYSACSYPESYYGVAIRSVPIESMTCADESYSIYIALLIGPVSFAGAILLVICCGSLHVFVTKMNNDAMTVYYPKPEAPQNVNRQQKWHNPPAHSPNVSHSRSAWHSGPTTTGIGHHAGIHTNLVLGQFAAHAHHDGARKDRVSSPKSEPRDARKRRTRDMDTDCYAKSAAHTVAVQPSSVHVKAEKMEFIDGAKSPRSSSDVGVNAASRRIDSRTDESQL